MYSTIKVLADSIKFLSTGNDGGHIYVRGKGTYKNYDIVDIYAHFYTKQMEQEFKGEFKNGIVEFVSSRWEFIPEIGLSLWDVTEWKFIDNI